MPLERDPARNREPRNGTGAMLFGVARDRLGSFGAALPFSATLLLASGGLLLTLGR